MQDMIESIRATVQLAARQGIAQARIALHPEDLGHITIRLTQTSDGLLARVSAETPAAIQALTDSRSELHQSLSSLGGTHVRLDISSFGNPQAGAREDRSGGSSGAGGSGSTSNDPDTAEDAGAQPEGADVSTPPVSSSPGALVDVLA